MIPLYLITTMSMTTELNVIIDNSLSWEIVLLVVRKLCSGSQVAEVLHCEHNKIGGSHYKKKGKLFIASIVYYLRGPCLCFLNIVNRNANKSHENFPMLWSSDFLQHYVSPTYCLILLFVQLYTSFHFNQFMLSKHSKKVNPIVKLSCNVTRII